jgi:hypothetical protein
MSRPKFLRTNHPIIVADAGTGEPILLNAKTALQLADEARAGDPSCITGFELLASDAVPRLHHNTAQSLALQVMMKDINQRFVAELQDRQKVERQRVKDVHDEYFVWRKAVMRRDHQYLREKASRTEEFDRIKVEAETTRRAREMNILQRRDYLHEKVEIVPEERLGRAQRVPYWIRDKGRTKSAPQKPKPIRTNFISTVRGEIPQQVVERPRSKSPGGTVRARSKSPAADGYRGEASTMVSPVAIAKNTAT